MNGNTGFHWFSRKGDDRKRNSDACASFSNDLYTLALIGDGSEKGFSSADYLMEWMHGVVREIAAVPAPNLELILKAMREGQLRIRHRFSGARACWSALFIDHKMKQAWGFSCGDCRVGILSENGSVTWVTPVHSVANCLGEDFTRDCALAANRHIVTRTLNAKRFDAPDVVNIKFEDLGRFILATDGHWIEREIEGAPLDALQDDASFLRVLEGNNDRSIDTDCGNCYHME